jgi:hypothetical protein
VRFAETGERRVRFAETGSFRIVQVADLVRRRQPDKQRLVEPCNRGRYAGASSRIERATGRSDARAKIIREGHWELRPAPAKTGSLSMGITHWRLLQPKPPVQVILVEARYLYQLAWIGYGKATALERHRTQHP